MKLSVLLITYNHEKYITEALESVLNQKFEYEMEIVIADDKSTDRTLEKIKKIEKKSNFRFRYLTSDKNLGITKNYKRGFNSCNGEFIAVLEGDDYWTDPLKLIKHVEFLESHNECTMSFNRYIVHNISEENLSVQPWALVDEFQYITSRDLIKNNFIGNFSTCVYRKKYIERLPEDLFDMTIYDWMTNIMIGRNGMIAYIGEVMSVYRVHDKGSWSGRDEIDNLKITLDAIDKYNIYLNLKYEDEFEHAKKEVLERIRLLQNKKIIGSENIEYIKSKNIKNIKEYIPPIITKLLILLLPPRLITKIKGVI